MGKSNWRFRTPSWYARLVEWLALKSPVTLRLQNRQRGLVVADQAEWTLSDSERRRISGTILRADQSSALRDTASVLRRHDTESTRASSRTSERFRPTAHDLMTRIEDILPTVKPRAALGSAVAAWGIAVTVVLGLFEVISW